MAMQQCPSGHLYDDTKNSSCPFCGNGNSVNVTVPLTDAAPEIGGADGGFGGGFGGGPAFPQTMPIDGFNANNYQTPTPQVVQDEIPMTLPVETSGQVTVALEDDKAETGIVKVRGWFVCIEGKKVGMDFVIGSGNNTIGRGASNTIKIDFDQAVSKGVNAIVTYDLRNNKFFIYVSGESKNNIYINGQLLMTPVELKDYDVIEIGTTKLLFRSLCNEKFTWENKAEAKAE